MNNTQPSSKKTWITIMIIVLVAALAYFYYQGATPITSPTLQQSQSGAVLGSQVLSLLKQIQSLKIDDKWFSDPVYRSLTDYSQPIPVQSVGRPNPFAPLPGVIDPRNNTVRRSLDFQISKSKQIPMYKFKITTRAII